MAVDADILRPSSDPAIRKETQNQDMARTICSMSIHTNLLSSLALSSIIRKEVADLHRNMQCQVAETFDFSFLVFIQPRPSFTLNS
ncbi:hypothetical protein PGT21_031151 [Puccinia graminis f. sp. tritici]|uniref:Uncharacterized protein n=1 Tax=Puccinia graminis f. sp. tritici TaxID=56615 RepID=A0A5B0PEK5_PUCGR|nr:hypothetical protein PGT21_031151 [Puccinia graminis f. sp. tritici]